MTDARDHRAASGGLDPLPEELVQRARASAPGSPEGAHLGDDVLARLRGDDENDDDAAAFRHLASCAACRARMASEAPKPIERVGLAVRSGSREVSSIAARHGATCEARGDGRAFVLCAPENASAIAAEIAAADARASVGRSRRQLLVAEAATDSLETEAWRAMPAATVVPLRRRGWTTPLAALAVAAALAIGVASLLRTPSPGFEVHMRSYAGTMGSASPDPGVPAADLNVELTVESKEHAAASLVVVGTHGEKLAPIRAFVREGTTLRLVVAPRTFAKHEGKAIALVIAGSESSVAKTAEEAKALPEVTEERLKIIAERQGARVARLEL